MKREIKFRSWNGYGMNHFTLKEISEFDTTARGTFKWPGDTVFMQFTGLLDKNGKDIYQSDLFQVASNRVYEVRWIDSLQVNSGGFETYYACFVLWESDEVFFPFDEFAMKNGEVIGNIYEHIHLLK